MGQYSTFIVRLWTDAAEDALRGHVQHIASRKGIYFKDTETMVRFIREHSEGIAPPADGLPVHGLDSGSACTAPDGGEVGDR